MGAGCDVKKHHFVGTLFVIADSQLNRIADISQATLFRTAKLHATCHSTIVHVQTGNDSFRQHEKKNPATRAAGK